MSTGNQNKSKEPEKEIRQPMSGTHRGPMWFDENDKELDNPRNVLWKFLFSYLKPYRGKLITFMILMLIGTAIMSLSPIISASIIDYGIIAQNAQFILLTSLIYLSLMLFMAISNYVSQYGMAKVSQNVVFGIRNDLFYKLQDMSLTYFDQHPSGDIISITTNDIDQLNMLVGGQFVMIISSILSMALTILFMYVLNPVLATISMIVFPIFLLMMRTFKRVVTGVFKQTRESISSVTSSIQENIAGAKVVQAYGQEKKATSEFDRANIQNYYVMLKIRKIMSVFFPLVTLVTSTLTACVILIGGFAVLGNVTILGFTVSVGVLSAYISILAQFFRPFMSLMTIQQVIESALAATDRIYSLLQERVEIPDPENPESYSDVKGEIEFKEVSFGYKLENGNDKGGKEGKPLKTPTSPMMQQNPMMKRAFDMIKTFPEPYSSFVMKNVMKMPMDIRMKLFMELMGVKPSNVPKKIDKILAEFKYAVPNTEMARTHPEYKTSFKRGSTKKTPGKPSKTQMGMGAGMGGMMPMNPQMISMMVKNLEKMLSSKSSAMTSGGGMNGEGGIIGGGMSAPSPQALARMLATMPIPEKDFQEFPKIVKDAIKEQKILIQHEQSRGYVLEDLNLKINPGSTIAIVGETGAGKTTTIKLISRFYDINKGSILLDGLDIRKVTKKELRDLIGLVPQDSFIFTGTIRENLLYAYEEPTPEIEKKMIEVSKFLGLHNFIETLHKKYDTKLKENGSNISIGQRQLIGFARALITDPKILILDEASSSVDPYTETLIQDALNKARKGRTTIIIAHRLSTIKNADHIVVLGAEKHGIVEEGTHESLLALEGKYKHLLEMQYKDIGIKN